MHIKLIHKKYRTKKTPPNYQSACIYQLFYVTLQPLSSESDCPGLHDIKPENILN